ncbi:CxC ATPase DNA modification system associated small protein [Azospirillum sp. SYSU D00513]|uniref:CxC ATPase DNA modification system associated small protein n=1 Tax=Azospirillum sp. SYSU D00513 TaxID=2812561 RepID=UPI001A96D4F8|nr:CxC ATPase DNA modification system associated small protein [Azospirillum sp. SYSU D00513]
MTRVNENVVAALKAAATDAGQPKEVAQRLVSWLDALATGNADLADVSEAANRIGDLLDQVKLPVTDLDLEALLGDEA